MAILKEGMYVRCPIDYEDRNLPRMFALAQITEVDLDFQLVKVEFHDILGSKESEVLYEHVFSRDEYLISNIKRCTLLEDSTVILSDFMAGKIICQDKTDEDGYINYYVQNIITGTVSSYSEKDIIANFTRGDVFPVVQMCDYEFHNPYWYLKRIIPSETLHTISNFSYGFETLIGARAYLIDHQIDTIIRAVCEEPCRFILADEVGLGKTIEACVIMNGLKNKKHKFKTLIIAPKSLCRQWQNEIDFKFWTKVTIKYSLDDIKNENIVIIPLEVISTLDIKDLLSFKWDLCIVDESHRLLRMKKEYETIKTISKNTLNLLLLSATPIQDRRDEYLRLLTLLNPNKYENMSNIEFNKLNKKSSNIREIVSKVYGELNDEMEDSEKEEIIEEILEEIEDISDILEDKIVDELIQQIEKKSYEEALEKIKLLIAYVSQNYQIERNIIRHRREEIKDKLAKRSLDLIEYDMAGSEVNYYESNTYDELITYIEFIQKNYKGNCKLEYIKMLLSTMFSSSWALRDIIKLRYKYINDLSIEEDDYFFCMNNDEIMETIRSICPVSEEKEIIKELLRVNDLWCKAADEEFNRLDELYDDPYLINGRLIKICDYIIEEDETIKYVLFSSWSSTVEKMKELLQKRFGEEAVATFYSKMNEDELEKNIFKFQSDIKCRFMICDELGGEGRNFQIADKIVHIDLPFSPVELEQRIGRLDRIGRDINNNVESIVIISTDGLDKDLFDLWNDGLNIFNESLSGMEIALEDIRDQIINGLNNNIQEGLKNTLCGIKDNSSKMREAVAKERYYDMARQLDRSTQDRFNKIINKFDKDGGELLGQTMINWAKASGWKAESDYETNNKDIIVFKSENISIKAMKNTLFILPDTKEALNRGNKNSCSIKGTFSRDLAVKKEKLVFFAPGQSIFDAIMTNCQEGYRGRCCAIKVKDSKYNWKGFLFKWNVKFNKKCLLDKGLNVVEASKAQGYLPIEQITSSIKLQGDEIPNYNEILEIIQTHELIHLGRRGLKTEDSQISIFMKEEPKDIWNKTVREAYKQSLKEVCKKVKGMIDFKKVDNYFEKILNGKIASNIYFKGEDIYISDEEELKDKIYTIKEGIYKAKLELDSVVYIWMER